MALAPFLVGCPRVITLGVRSSLEQYDENAKALLREADKIFFPTMRFVDLFEAAAKPTFPAASTYRYQRSRVLQQLLFDYLELTSPPTRVYYGARQKALIERDFEFPLLAMGDRPGAIPEMIVGCRDTLRQTIERCNPLLIRKYIRWRHRVRFLCVGRRVFGAQIRIPADQRCDGFWMPIFDSEADRRPRSATAEMMRLANLDDVVIEWGYADGKWYCAGLRRPPPKWRTVDGAVARHDLISEMVMRGEL